MRFSHFEIAYGSVAGKPVRGARAHLGLIKVQKRYTGFDRAKQRGLQSRYLVRLTPGVVLTRESN